MFDYINSNFIGEPMQELNILDLFSGSGSWSKNWRNNTTYNIHIDSVDLENREHITHCMDVRDFEFEREYHFIYSSPPCNKFSRLNNFHKPSKEELKEALDLAEVAFSISRKAKFAYIIENPATGLLPQIYPNYQVVDYSEYNYPLRKRTAIWSNVQFNFKTKTDISYNRLPLSYLSRDDKWKIPKQLTDYIKWVFIKRFNNELKNFRKLQVK